METERPGILSRDEALKMLAFSGTEWSERGRYHGVPSISIARLIKRGWVVSEVRDFFVIQGERNKGNGKKLLGHIMAEAETPMIIMTVREENTGMRGLVSGGRGFYSVGTIISPSGNRVIVYISVKDAG